MKIICDDGSELLYDLENSCISKEYGMIETVAMNQPFSTKAKPGKKSKDVFKLLIQFGLSCNYSCGYCSQRYMPFDEADNLKDSSMLLEKLKTLNLTAETQVQLWGGEPLVYWKSIKHFVPKLREMGCRNIQMTTNGSLLNQEKVDWAIANQVFITVSHDGPGQKTRAEEDILDNPKIVDCIKQLMAKDLFSFNPTIYKQNQSRVAIFDYFHARFGDNFKLANAEFIRPYDLETKKFSLNTTQEHIEYRKLFLKELLTAPEKLSRFDGIQRKIGLFALHYGQHTKVATLPSHCGVDLEGFLTLNLKGEVVTCMNDNTVIGHIDKLEETVVNTVNHWSDRANCHKCPVLPVCLSSCPIQEGENFYSSCDNEFSDMIAIWAAFIKHKFGVLPVYIDGDLPEYRKDIFGFRGTALQTKRKTVIPILAK